MTDHTREIADRTLIAALAAAGHRVRVKTAHHVQIKAAAGGWHNLYITAAGAMKFLAAGERQWWYAAVDEVAELVRRADRSSVASAMREAAKEYVPTGYEEEGVA